MDTTGILFPGGILTGQAIWDQQKPVPRFLIAISTAFEKMGPYSE
jgi:hypothetical protein